MKRGVWESKKKKKEEKKYQVVSETTNNDNNNNQSLKTSKEFKRYMRQMDKEDKGKFILRNIFTTCIKKKKMRNLRGFNFYIYGVMMTLRWLQTNKRN